ncbi:hypothetical protein DLNHIDIE_03589 [Acidithiobacillus thiooxidans ATCC 19377]|uniref:Uncharacterized protein n=1 Tax=Acidithiobacillus thiooxidans ATCC 19377 TaxID=637390 RepID=A0A543PYC5_ACITH|nr:hypothetical protein DLNHIDIE_03589 [Acidithiobacillus thiooxidans ATCC 19377]
MTHFGGHGANGNLQGFRFTVMQNTHGYRGSRRGVTDEGGQLSDAVNGLVVVGHNNVTRLQACLGGCFMGADRGNQCPDRFFQVQSLGHLRAYFLNVDTEPAKAKLFVFFEGMHCAHCRVDGNAEG